jgi:hypothetical protein
MTFTATGASLRLDNRFHSLNRGVHLVEVRVFASERAR